MADNHRNSSTSIEPISDDDLRDLRTSLAFSGVAWSTFQQRVVSALIARLDRAEAENQRLDLDLVTAIARIEQLGREGADTCGGLLLDRLVTCDSPRLRSHVSARALANYDRALQGEPE